MARVIVQHHVADYDKWLPVFTEHEVVRRRYGATGHSVNRSVDDPNLLVVVNEFASVEGAREFSQDPGLREVMQRAGVDAAPQVWILEESQAVSY